MSLQKLVIRLNSGRIIRLLCRMEPLCAPMCSIHWHFAADWKQLVTSYPGAFSVTSYTLTIKAVKFGNPRSNRSREIPLEALAGGIFDGFVAITSDRKYK